jgi:hypothetical protein
MHIEPFGRIVWRDAIASPPESEAIASDAIGIGNHRKHAHTQDVSCSTIRSRQWSKDVLAPVPERRHTSADRRKKIQFQLPGPQRYGL